MAQNLRKIMKFQIEKMQEMFNKELQELKNKQRKINNTITAMKNMLEVINSRIVEAEEQIRKLEDRNIKITTMEETTGKRMKKKKMRTVSETSGTI